MIKLSNIYYKLQYKTEIERLNLYLKQSLCKGFLVPKRHFFKEDKKTKQKQIDESFIKSIESLNKEVILYKNYYNDRPYLIDPQTTSLNDETKEKLQKDYSSFVSDFQGANLEKYFKKEISESIQIIDFVEKYKNRPRTLIEKKLFKSHDKFKVSCFTIPFLPAIPIKISKKGSFFKKLNSINEKAIEELYNLSLKYVKTYNLNNHIPIIVLNLEDYMKYHYDITEIIKKYEFFNKIGLWIVDFNEISASKKEMKEFYDIIEKFNSVFAKLFVFYIGVCSSRLIDKINPNIKKIIRISGYPGLNVNIPAMVPRTRRFYFQRNGRFYNDRGFSEDLLRKPSLNYNCKCSSCYDFRIKSLQRAFDIYFQNPVDVNAYNKFRGNAIKTLKEKLKTKQNIFLMNHNFYNVDRQLHSDLEKFTKEIFSTNLKMNNWELLKKKKEEIENELKKSRF